jgi:microcystin-dependent protein
MATPYLSELRLVSFNFPPRGWAMANGQLLPINQNQALFSLLGTTYGGDGRQNFALPNLQGRVPLHTGGGFTLGQNGGEPQHTLSIAETPQHFHSLQGINANQNTGSPGNAFVANTGSTNFYAPPNSLSPMFPGDISNTGGSQPHPNQSPYLVMTWIIALQGIFPSQN